MARFTGQPISAARDSGYAGEITQQIPGRLVTSAGIFFQTTADNPTDRHRNPCRQFRSLIQNGAHGFDLTVLLKGAPAGQHFVENDAETEYVSSLIGRLPTNL